jgi:hypothetical protein
MRTNYQKPNTKIVMLKHQALMLINSPAAVTTVNTNLGDDAITVSKVGGTGNSRSRSYDDWDDDEDF